MGDALGGVPLGEGAVMMVVIRQIQAVRKGQIREKKKVATHWVVWQQGWGGRVCSGCEE